MYYCAENIIYEYDESLKKYVKLYSYRNTYTGR
jgi:hypothetical protein